MLQCFGNSFFVITNRGYFGGGSGFREWPGNPGFVHSRVAAVLLVFGHSQNQRANMKNHTILGAVQSGRVLVSDGAWGTFFQKKGIKPGDAMIIGLYQRYNDQIGQTAQFVREILA